MVDPASRKVIRSGRVRELLNLGEEALRRRRREPGFPKTLAMPGRPRWYEDEILAWRDGQDCGDIAAGAFLANSPDLAGLSPEEQHAAALKYFRQLEADAQKTGREKAALPWRWAIEALELAGPSIMGTAARFLQRSNLTDRERSA